MKIRNVVGDVIAEIPLNNTEDMILTLSVRSGSEDSILVWMQIFRKVYEAGVAKGRAYDPRKESPRDPDGLVGPSDAESIGVPFCSWCGWGSHFGPCRERRKR